jgi:hypothetical protein
LEWRKHAYIFPSIWIRVAELIVVDAHYMAVSTVEVGKNVVFVAFPGFDVTGYASGGPELRSWKFGERVEIDSVNCSRKEANNELISMLVLGKHVTWPHVR